MTSIDPTKPIDVLVPTYNSASYLDQALTAIKRSVPINRIIAVDRYSSDRTFEILKNHEAEVYFENKSLGYARQLLIEKAGTDVFMMLDSDVLISEADWYPNALKLLRNRNGEGRPVGAVVLLPMSRPPIPLQKYTEFWWRLIPALERNFFLTNSTLFLKDSVEGIRIPEELGAAEDVYIWLHIRGRGYTTFTMKVRGIHHFAHGQKKGYWMGANLRILQKLVGKAALPFVIRNVMAYPALALVAAFFTKDANVLKYNLKRWYGYLRGYLFPQKFYKISR